VLRPGGSFVIFEHNKLNPLIRWIVARIPLDRNAVLLTGWRAQKLVRKAGFRDIDCRCIYSFRSRRHPYERSKATWVGYRWARSTASRQQSNFPLEGHQGRYKSPTHHVLIPKQIPIPIDEYMSRPPRAML
jgi:hypothetical protein